MSSLDDTHFGGGVKKFFEVKIRGSYIPGLRLGVGQVLAFAVAPSPRDQA